LDHFLTVASVDNLNGRDRSFEIQIYIEVAQNCSENG
jgi:hypothetical protein